MSKSIWITIAIVVVALVAVGVLMKTNNTLETENFVLVGQVAELNAKVKEQQESTDSAIAELNKKVEAELAAAKQQIAELSAYRETEMTYSNANKLLADGQYSEAVRQFESLGGYEDASRLAMYCKAMEAGEQGEYDTAIRSFEAFGDYKDSAYLTIYYQGRREEQTGSELQEAIAAEIAEENDGEIVGERLTSLKNAMSYYRQIPLFRDSEARTENCRKVILDAARFAAEQDSFTEAANAAGALEDEESKKLTVYYTACAREQEGDLICEDPKGNWYAAVKIYEEAVQLLETVPDIQDAPDHTAALQEKIYQIALSLKKAGGYEEAIELFSFLADDQNSKSQIADCERLIRERVYAAALTLKNEGEYEEAIAAFQSLEGYRESRDQIAACEAAIRERDAYAAALTLKNEGKYEEAITAFRAMEGYQDSKDQIAACEEAIREQAYAAALKLKNEGKYEEAIPAFRAMEGYQDSKDQIAACEEAIRERAYAAALTLKNEGKYEEAITVFRTVEDYRDSRDQIAACEAAIRERDAYAAALTLKNEGKYEEAITAFRAMEGYQDSQDQIAACEEAIRERAYAAAMTLKNEGKHEEAAAAFRAMEGYRDSEEMIAACETADQEKAYKAALALKQNGEYQKAVEAFTAISDYRDAKTQIRDVSYLQAKALVEQGDYEAAAALYSTIRGHKNVDFLLENDQRLASVLRRQEMTTVGGTFTFGRYRQSDAAGSGKEPLEWLILEVDENRVLLISQNTLTARAFHNSHHTNITWGKSSLRSWLNRDFINSAFNTAERACILRTDVDNSPAQGYEGYIATTASDTQDKVFLLSYAEAWRYFGSNEQRISAPTAYAASIDDESSMWWLRSSGSDQERASYVMDDGTLGSQYATFNCGIRPAMWVDLESDLIRKYIETGAWK